MSSKSFRSVFMVASCAGAALGCYLVSLRVASERAALENVETRIVLAQRDIRLLQTEIGTRGRLAQLERWNVRVLALSAPSADQFLDGGFALAKLVAPQGKVDLDAPVVLAAAPADGPRPQIEGTQVEGRQPEPDAEGVSAREMLHVASLKRGPRPVEKAVAATRPAPERTMDKPVTAKAPAAKAAKAQPAKSRPATAERKPAASDPLAPLNSAAKPKKLASTTNVSGKDSGSKQ
ncbi:MAG: hypothetical protein ACR2KH_00410 [Sphingomicrobium sp.]